MSDYQPGWMNDLGVIDRLSVEAMEAQEKAEGPTIIILDTDNTDFPVCPHCGHEHRNYCEFTNDGKYDCASCEKPFDCTSEMIVHFTTEKIKEQPHATK